MTQSSVGILEKKQEAKESSAENSRGHLSQQLSRESPLVWHGRSEPRLKEACGVAVVMGLEQAHAAVQMALVSLQHRGEDGFGIASRLPSGWQLERGLGRIATKKEALFPLDAQSQVAIGHVRYATMGGVCMENTQPFLFRLGEHSLILAHNGQLTGVESLRRELLAQGAVFQSNADTELIGHLLIRQIAPCLQHQTHVLREEFEQALTSVLARVTGAYALVVGFDQEVYVARDPHGLRPLSIGSLCKEDGGSVCVAASESCAFTVLGAKRECEVEPGTWVRLSAQSADRKVNRFSSTDKRAFCSFEYIYFARPDSILEGHNVQAARARMGARLAQESQALDEHVDLVSAVPDSGVAAAIHYARSAGISYEPLLVKNHYSGRSFIQPSQDKRQSMLRQKLVVLEEQIAGKSVILVDDSLVRGNTAKHLIKMVRQAGAKEVHLRICAPPVRYPCFFGIDIPTREELIATQLDVEQIRAFLEVDSLRFLSIEGLESVFTEGFKQKTDLCLGCFSGRYCEEGLL